ncbi:MAG: ImmA/IrrE family metallo-endopeptidase [Prevotella sp.]|nr:ImmA/IrrE family metallo-endopeptidase [Prevotella sp.]
MLNRAQEKAVELLDEFGIEDIQDVDIRDLVYAKDIIYREAPLENYDGRIVYGKRGKALITVNSNLTYVPRKRFTIAHELGHYILGHNRKEVAHDNQASTEFYKSGSQETEANQFASELLMPTSVFLEYIEGERFSPRLMHDLAEEFKTSVTSVVYKYLECGSHPIAVFYSYKNKIKYWKKSADYRRMVKDLNNLPVPPCSVAEEWYKEGVQYKPDDIQKIELNVWFDLWDKEENGWGYEYCLVSPKYNTVLSVVWED